MLRSVFPRFSGLNEGQRVGKGETTNEEINADPLFYSNNKIYIYVYIIV